MALMTNGCLITGEDAERMRDLGVFDVQVSLEGPPPLHDEIRGRGSFAAASRGVKRLVRAGNTVSLNVTLSRLNAGLIDETVGLARDLGVRAIGFSRLVPCGAGESMLDHFLTADEVRKAYEHVRALLMVRIWRLSPGTRSTGLYPGMSPRPAAASPFPAAVQVFPV